MLFQVCVVFSLPIIICFVAVFGQFVEIKPAHEEEEEEEIELLPERSLRSITKQLLKEKHPPRYLKYTSTGYVERT